MLEELADRARSRNARFETRSYRPHNEARRLARSVYEAAPYQSEFHPHLAQASTNED
jgi:hypothetical protein